MFVTIAEELLLLAYREADGKPLVSSTELDAGVGGALLAELALSGRLDLGDKKITAADPAPTGDPELDDALALIAARDRPQKPEWWINRLRPHDRRKRLLGRLAERGALTEEKIKILGLFPATRYPERDPGMETEIRDRLWSTLTGADPDERTAVLIAILRACKLDRKVFPEADKKRVKEIAEGDWAGTAVARTIASINAAVAAGVAAAAAATAASAS
ncbi:GPP34 family phosphoprotein [Spongiactinospora sp. TRM90649]|uniref:GOLPH3/VPS74 family protein n=1 Tax=Spongiactinospora sp. TRM90649 TaxID=3031114 RepID=UPI0023F92D56|nr:GPP34 family phosphoprotein [Spongiactinospora sp. TRM90649]MDF5752988.1 GPP34 family phosphoprotein [Spongiactinospora sp. TRM90649]